MDELTKVEKVEALPKSAEETVYVTIPETDMYDTPYPTIQLNRVKFEAGNTYKVPAAVGAEVEDRKQKYEKECIRLLRPKADVKSLNQVNKGSQWSTRGGGTTFSAEKGITAEPGERVITVKW